MFKWRLTLKVSQGNISIVVTDEISIGFYFTKRNMRKSRIKRIYIEI
jgi:hypothetical protein